MKHTRDIEALDLADSALARISRVEKMIDDFLGQRDVASEKPKPQLRVIQGGKS